MDESKRRFLTSSLYGAGFLALRALATGIPVGILANPRTARADVPPSCGASPQYLILATSGSGDPLNANVPGTYEDAGVYHSVDPLMAPTTMTFGSRSLKAALPWTQLSSSILARTSFFHHGTYTNGHGDAPKVNRLMGAVKRQEMLVSLIAKNNATCMQTVQQQPAVLSRNLITFAGSVLPTLSPPNLQAVLAAPTGPLAQLQAIRDQDVNKLNDLFKSTGNTAQRAILDKYALSQTEARSLSQALLSDLAQIKGTSRQDQNIAAAVLIKMNVTPVVVMNYSFGGDNHGDTGLAGEARETIASTVAITDLIMRLSQPAYNLQDKVTIAFQNVFGRTLKIDNHSGNADGRNHNATHHCSVFIGSGFKGSVIGGIELNSNGSDYRATGFDATTGSISDSGDVPYEQTLGAAGKTLGAACGVPAAVLDDQITLGKVVPAALA
ncbi:hypothetical protein BH11MYX1_BH11MYX1_39230 [soil metagenome]